MVNLSLGFWNIAGLRDKMENDLVRDWMYSHDIIVLSEIKTRGDPSLPGYTPITNIKSNHGVSVLVRSGLYPKIMINVEDEGVIAIELSCFPGIRFCGMYNVCTMNQLIHCISDRAHLPLFQLTSVVGSCVFF